MVLAAAHEIELAGLRAWPGIEVEWDRRWVRRAANGHTQRANSTQCFDPADGADAPRRVAAVRRWYEARGLRPTFRVNLLTSPALLDALDAEGWLEVDRSRVLAMDLEPMAPDPRVEVLALDDLAFLAAQRQLKQYDDATFARFRAILAAFEVPARGIVLRRDGNPLASALMAIADGIVITGNVVTAASERRRGHAAAVMRTGFAWAVRDGARVAALNVQAGNAPALALYGGLGLVPQYDYCYRTPGRP